eukprot:10290379-Alexandrium_andersonii.AAC.1
MLRSLLVPGLPTGGLAVAVCYAVGNRNDAAPSGLPTAHDCAFAVGCQPGSAICAAGGQSGAQKARTALR